MGKKAIQWLYQELPGLVARGILAQEAADRLRQYYGEVKSVSKKWTVLIICGTVGALLIGLGIILLFGHNWEQLSRGVRAALSLAPLVIGQALALWVLQNKPESSALKEGVATFLSLMVGASIALIAQTYHIPGDTGTFMLTWMLLIAPLVYLMQASLPAAIYLMGITAWAGSYWNNPSMAVLFWPLAAVVVPHFIWALRKEIYTIRTTILSLVMVLCVSFGTGFSLGKTWPGSWIVIYPSIFAIIYALGHQEFRNVTTNWQRPLRLIGTIGIPILAFQFTFRYTWEYMHSDYHRLGREILSLSTLPDYVITWMIVGAAMLLFYDNVKRRDLTASLFTALPLLALMSYFLNGKAIILPLLIFNAYLFILSVSRIAEGIRNNNLGAINVGMLILAILILARFFDSDINFIMKGLAFITIGIGFLVTNVVLMRRKGGEQ